MLYVTLDGRITVFQEFGNIVPTGISIAGAGVLMAEAGAVPASAARREGGVVAAALRREHRVRVGRAALGRCLSSAAEENSTRCHKGCSRLVRRQRHRRLPNTGSLVQAQWNGTFRTVAEDLDVPTSVELIGDNAYVVTLNGEIWKIKLDGRH